MYAYSLGMYYDELALILRMSLLKTEVSIFEEIFVLYISPLLPRKLLHPSK